MTVGLSYDTMPPVKKIALRVVLFVKEEMAEIVELSLLYDFYGELLKEHNKKIFEAYVLNDYSFSEIAVEEGITRQGVYDIVKRCIKQLRDYEEQLHLIEKFDRTKGKVIEIAALLKEISLSERTEAVDRAEQLVKEILQEL